MSFRFSDFEIDAARRELRRSGAIVHIEPQVFDLLVHLVRNRERVVGKDELIDSVWQGRIVSESTLSSRISAARRALGDSGNDQSLIRTLHKRGFRFVGDVEDESSATGIATIAAKIDSTTLAPAGEPLPFRGTSAMAVLHLPESDAGLERDADGLTAVLAFPSPASVDHASAPGIQNKALRDDREPDTSLFLAATTTPIGQPAWRSAASIGAAISLVSLLIAAGWWLKNSPFLSRDTLTPDPVVLAKAALLPADRVTAQASSIVVVPFINLSADTKQDYIVDGITDGLISDLSRALPGISVASRDTAFTYKGRAVDARQIGRELEVRYLLSGSVALEGGLMRVNIQLVETRDGNQLWTERFDTERTSILQVQDEVVSRVSRATGLKVVDIEARRSRRERPTSTELMDLVLRGKAALNLPSSPATMIEARGLFEQALKVDQNDADALAGVASTLVFEFLNGYYEAEGDERLTRAEGLLDQASDIEPRNLMVLKAKAALRRAQGKFEDAIAAAEAIIVENPGEPWAYKEIGLSKMYLGQPEQALDWFARADRIGPHDPGRWTWLDGRGHDLILLGREEEAVRSLVAALDANPKNFSSHAFLAAAYALLGHSDDARASLAVYLQKRPETKVSTFRRLSPVPLALTSSIYQQQHERVAEGLRKAGMPE